MSKIIEALKQFDATNDEHWTADGAPRMDVLEGFLGEKATRDDVKSAAPKFNRATMDLGTQEAVEEQASQPWQQGHVDEPEMTGDGVLAETAGDVEEPVDLGNDEYKAAEAAAYARVEKAKLAHEETGRELQEAMDDLDSYIVRAEQAKSNVSQADNIATFQRQQQEQRAAKVQQQRLLANLVNGSK